MKPALLAPALSLLLGAAQAERVELAGTSLSLEVPAGFTKMPQDIIDLKYSRGRPPSTVYSTPGPSWAVNIAFDRRDVAVKPEQLKEIQGVLEKSVQGVAGLRWVKRGLQTSHGRPWVVLQFWVQGLDTTIYNDLRATSDGGKLLLVTANVTRELYPQYVRSLSAAMDSLK
ncbi:hypothetical protein [Deinococcus koreensis]|uniref:DUF1795 domain-containing protein n=1 Tax=Deinococcus koreensis TaxID=2054903 RepID=A0A2K3UXH4_9DEIO|nr:hypothetical protein [Deinococcus koreensis]PNY81240.1 hypothetical protein CVO96_07450 [Deinococcus koreensis]